MTRRMWWVKLKIEVHYDFDLILSFQTPRCLQHWICKSSPSLVLWQVTKTAQAQIRENISTSQCAVCIVLTLSKVVLCTMQKFYVTFRKFACCTGILRRTQFKSLQLEKHLNCSQPTRAQTIIGVPLIYSYLFKCIQRIRKIYVIFAPIIQIL